MPSGPSSETATEAFCRLYEPTPDCTTPACTRNQATWLCECRPDAAPEKLCE
jgi:hypothetical protein